MAFSGFPKQTIAFLSNLQKNNNKAWFSSHREDYEKFFLAPALSLVPDLGALLKRLDSRVHAEPKVNGSIGRINRDIRFSHDKSPYKDHLDLWFWTGANRKDAKPGYFFRLRPDSLVLGVGMHEFESAMLTRYRKAVLDPHKGAALVSLVTRLTRAGYEFGGKSYKRVPAGLPADHPRAELLKHDSLHVATTSSVPKEAFVADFTSFCAHRYAAMAPLCAWLAEI